MNLTDMYRIIPFISYGIHILLSSPAYGIFSKIDYKNINKS
jgi:hypothetical protein